MPIELKAEAVRLFAEIGFLGLSRGNVAQAEVIFSMLTNLRPGEEAGAVGLALASLAGNRPDVAIRLLKSAEQTPAVIAFSALTSSTTDFKLEMSLSVSFVAFMSSFVSFLISSSSSDFWTVTSRS